MSYCSHQIETRPFRQTITTGMKNRNRCRSTTSPCHIRRGGRGIIYGLPTMPQVRPSSLSPHMTTVLICELRRRLGKCHAGGPAERAFSLSFTEDVSFLTHLLRSAVRATLNFHGLARSCTKRNQIYWRLRALDMFSTATRGTLIHSIRITTAI